MATNVIHGTGKPRFVLPSSDFLQYVGLSDLGGYYNTVSSSTTTTLVFATGFDMTQLDETYGIRGMGVWSLNSSDEDTWGVAQSYVDGTETITVDAWSNDNPANGKKVFLIGRYIDLPYCQRLTETFTPDYITKKMLNGEIKYIKRGFYYSAVLDYGRYLHKDEMEIIRYLYEASMNGCGFYPRKDNTAILYSVDIDPEGSISFYQLQNHQGHGGVIINITGIERLSRIPFNDPTVSVTYAVSDDTDKYATDDEGQFPTAD